MSADRTRLVTCTARMAFDRPLGRLFTAAGYQRWWGWPGERCAVGVWGKSRYAWRGERLAKAASVPLIRIEDAFLRSLHPGRAGAPPLGLIFDDQGVYYDASQSSLIEARLAAWHDDPAKLARASALIARLRQAHISKYSATRVDLPLPEPGFVLVVDQTQSDASIHGAGADRARFAQMLAAARADHPSRPIVIKTHPETARGLRSGHFGLQDRDHRTSLLTDPISPWHLLDRAHAVYCVGSLMGFEAILAGHRPVLFGQPFYAGWGLSDDRYGAPKRRQRRLSAEALAHVALIDTPVWVDPYHQKRAEVETIVEALAAQARAWREDHQGWIGGRMRLWKRAHLNRFFGHVTPLRFVGTAASAAQAAQQTGKNAMAWGAENPPGVVNVEDGFLRSKGLGAALVPPLSLVLDDLGMYYDPNRESRLERLITNSPQLSVAELQRARAIMDRIRAESVSKYNLETALPALPKGYRVLVAGQVADDASIRLGAGAVRDDASLLRQARAARPDAVLIYKPHPDVVAGLRAGGAGEGGALADLMITEANPAQLLEAVDELWTITSLMGFEALLRGVKVTVLGRPFYAGWGLTQDLGSRFERRTARPDLAQLVHAALIDYPRYYDPQSGLACPPEIALDRLRDGTVPRPSLKLRLLAKLQGALASHAWIWR